MTGPEPLVAGVELGGTKSLAVLARGPDIIESVQVPTAEPGPTLDRLAEAVAGWSSSRPLAAIGVASFGPLALDPASTDYGRITTTPKPGWAGAPVLERLAGPFDLPAALETDVAGAALAEHAWGAAQGCGVVVYLTIGTGVGGGLVVDGAPVHGRVHPEMGHVRIRRAPGERFAGVCPFHGDCVEGLVSGPALAARAGVASADGIGDDHPVWALAAEDLAELCAALVVTVSPDRILIGGGIGVGRPALFPAIRSGVIERLAGYVAGLDSGTLETMIGPPGLGVRAGPLGAAAVARLALARARG